jgi:DNA polymerase-3 subunit delta
MDSLTFLERLDKAVVQPLYVVHGNEVFLKGRVLTALRRLVLGPDEGFALTTYPGDKAVWASVMDELRTLPFLSPRRLVVVENADPFVTDQRDRLEKFVAALDKAPSTGTLVLDVKVLAANTRLAKLLPDPMNIACKTPQPKDLVPWCARHCSATYGKQLSTPAARLLLDLIGPEMGLLDQELAKLAAYVGAAAKIEAPDVDKLVGRSRSENTWQLFNLIGTGKTDEALTFVGKLLEQGEDPVMLLGAFRKRLRDLVMVGRLRIQGVARDEAFERTGIDKQFIQQQVEQHLRHVGRRRLDQVYDWLLQTDLGLKGGSTLPPRTLFERLVIQLARPRT